MSYYTAEQKRNISRLNTAIARKKEELAALPAKLKGRHPKDVARIARYVQVDIAYLQGYRAQWEAVPASPLCMYAAPHPEEGWAAGGFPAYSPTVGTPSREG